MSKKAKQVQNNDLNATLVELKGKSAQIRYLDSIGKTRKEIVTIMSELHGKAIRYQHVRNVLVTLLKKDMNKE